MLKPTRILSIHILAAGSVASAQPTTFQDAQQGALQTLEMAFGMVGGAAAGDFDNDGDCDLFVASGLRSDSLILVNDGSGNLTPRTITTPAGPAHNDRAGLWVDYDADADLDLLVFADNHRQDVPTEATNLRLFRNDKGNFTEVTAQAGLYRLLEDPFAGTEGFLAHGSGLLAADFNNDGAIDIYATFWSGRNYLFQNNANGTFTDITPSTGMQSFTTHWQPGAVDLDRDGDMDIVQPVDFTNNKVFRNNGNGTFTDIAPQLGMNNAMNDMGIAIGDPDNDQDFDIFITNIHDAFTPMSDLQGRHNVFYRNNTQGFSLSFSEDSEEARVDKGDWGWGCTFVDIDHDGWQDLAQTNGFNVNPARGFATDRTRLFSNSDRGIRFTEVAQQTLCDDDDIGSCYISLDIDSDGDRDLFQVCQFAPPRLRLNELESSAVDRGWLTIKPRSVVPGSSGQANSYAIGAVVRVTHASPDGPRTQSRLITAGTSLLGQEPAEAHFGLGQGVHEAMVVRVEWPSGQVTTHPNMRADRNITLVDASVTSPDLNRDGLLNQADLTLAETVPFDITGDRVYDKHDIRAVRSAVTMRIRVPEALIHGGG